MNYEIQSLRAIALLAVLLGHMPITLPNFLLHGYSFVSLFLAISGYFAMKSMKKYDALSKPKTVIIKELGNRLMRLLPLMWIWILIYFLIGNCTVYLFGGQFGSWERWGNELFHAFIGDYNYYLAGLNIGGLFGQYWTLYVELHFAFLFIILFAFIKSKKKRIAICTIVILLTIFVFRPLTPVFEVRYATQCQLDSLFAGVLVALLTNDEEKLLAKYNIPHIVKNIVALMLCAALFFSAFFFDNFLNNMNIKYTAYLLISISLLIIAIENDGWCKFNRIADKALAWIGGVSASAYVAHVIFYSCIYYNIYSNTDWIPLIVKTTWWGAVLQVITLIAVALFAGFISLQLIEKPYRSFAKKLFGK